MSWWRTMLGLQEPEQLDESLKSFKNKAKNQNIQGEGYEDIQAVTGFGQTGTSSFNMFYDRHINKQLKTDKAKLNEYRKMADMPEISDVIENAAIEATAEDDDGKVLRLEVTSEEINKNENIMKNLDDEFNSLFYDRIKIKSIIQDYFKSYMIDGKLFLENIINKSRPSKGILGIKRLPAETMDFDVDPSTGKTILYYQFLTENAKKPTSIEEAEESKDVVVFYPAQISYIDSGIYGVNKKDVLGFLHRCRQPFNQLRLLETSVVIYRLIRSPERLVFRIDTGNMPKDKAMKYVEKIKNKFTKKQVYDPETGNLSNATDVNSILENYFLAQSSDGRGSQIESIGGNPSGFSELDDIYYFQKKLYRSLKYPMSRVMSMHEGANREITFGDDGQIARDEIKWAKFLEFYQNRICDKLLDLFLVHLEFLGLKKQYELDKNMIQIRMNPPNNYLEEIQQSIVAKQFENYTALASNDEFSKTFLMRRYLNFTDDDLKELKKGFDDDKKFIVIDDEGGF